MTMEVRKCERGDLGTVDFRDLEAGDVFYTVIGRQVCLKVGDDRFFDLRKMELGDVRREWRVMKATAVLQWSE